MSELSFQLALARASDAAALAAIYRPSVVSGIASFEEAPPDEHEMAERIARVLAWTPWVVAVRGSEVLGYAYGARYRERAAYRWTVETSAYVAEAHHRTGVARALYAALLRLLHAQGFATAYARIVLPNAASVALHEAIGFAASHVLRGVGFKGGAWRDVGVWARELAPRTVPPREPTPLPALSDLEGLLAPRR